MNAKSYVEVTDPGLREHVMEANGARAMLMSTRQMLDSVVMDGVRKAGLVGLAKTLLADPTIADHAERTRKLREQMTETQTVMFDYIIEDVLPYRKGINNAIESWGDDLRERIVEQHPIFEGENFTSATALMDDGQHVIRIYYGGEPDHDAAVEDMKATYKAAHEAVLEA